MDLLDNFVEDLPACYLELLSAVKCPLFVNEGNWIYPEPVNIVHTVELTERLDIQAVSRKIKNQKLNFREFACVDIRTLNLGTLLCFNSGKIVCVGVQAISAAHFLILFYRAKFLDFGIAFNIKSIEVNNFVLTVELGYFVDLARFYHDYQDGSKYIPRRFSAVKYELNSKKGDQRTTIMIFEKYGRFNIMGVKTYAKGFKSGKKMQQLLKNYRRDKRQTSLKIVDIRQKEKDEIFRQRPDYFELETPVVSNPNPFENLDLSEEAETEEDDWMQDYLNTYIADLVTK